MDNYKKVVLAANDNSPNTSKRLTSTISRAALMGNPHLTNAAGMQLNRGTSPSDTISGMEGRDPVADGAGWRLSKLFVFFEVG
jgi:hypothetical protein